MPAKNLSFFIIYIKQIIIFLYQELFTFSTGFST